MAKNKDQVDLEAFEQIARDRRDWRRALKESSHDVQAPELTILTELSRTESTWQLAISALAYIDSQSLENGDGFGLGDLAQALTSLPGRRSVPRFENVATTVSNMPYRALIRAAPRLSSVLRHAPPISAASSVRVLHCLERYPNGGPELLRCIAGK